MSAFESLRMKTTVTSNFPLYCLSLYYVCYRFSCQCHTGFVVVLSLSSKPKHIIWFDHWMCIPRLLKTPIDWPLKLIWIFFKPADVWQCTFAIWYMVTDVCYLGLYHRRKYGPFIIRFFPLLVGTWCSASENIQQNKLKSANCSILCG